MKLKEQNVQAASARFSRMLVVSALLLSWAGCGNDNAPNVPVGEASIDLKLSPQGVLCVTIQAQGSSTVVQQYNVAPAANTTFDLTGLPTGAVTFSAKAYSVPCAQIATATPTFTSNGVPATLTAGTPASVSLSMQAQGPTGSAHVGVDFPAPSSTNPITMFAVPTANGRPTGIAAGPDGNLWFTEAMGNKIGRITPAGVFTEFPIPTANAYPQAITAGPDGNLWFTEDGGIAGKIGRITPAGVITEFTISVPGDLLPAIVTGPDGNLWFTEYTRSKVGRISTTGSITEFDTPTPNGGPNGIAAGADGNLWYLEEDAGKIVRLTPIGVTTEYACTGLFAITAGADGNLWFTGGPGVGRITTAGVITTFAVPNLSGGPNIATGPDGNVWFGGPAYLGRVTPAGVITQTPVPSPFHNEQPSGQAAGPDGNLWFVMPLGNSIGRLSL